MHDETYGTPYVRKTLILNLFVSRSNDKENMKESVRVNFIIIIIILIKRNSLPH